MQVEEPSKVPKVPRRQARVSRVSWPQFKASKLPGIKADLERQWEMLVADPEARDLLAMRYDSTQSSDAALVQFREELDRMISERTDALERGAASGGRPRGGIARRSPCEVPPQPALVRRLG
ncbi:unnamed protein product, partial [Symbiodinium pilosum]